MNRKELNSDGHVLLKCSAGTNNAPEKEQICKGKGDHKLLNWVHSLYSIMKWVLFDLLGVIIESSGSYFKKWLLARGLSPSAVNKAYGKEAWALQKGRMSPETAVAHMSNTLHRKLSAKEFFGARVGGRIIVNNSIIVCVKALKKAGFKVGLCTDISRPSWRAMKKQRFISLFDDALASCNTHYRKEEISYYRYMARRLGCNRRDILLIDDNQEIVRVARRAGIRAIHFRSLKDLKKIC